ncbi:MAG: hypothetical protein KDA86_19700 [Planctomycetaceae bacterium]|nr:hypothetical protein [Planctomycetaceae bacterium]
MAKVTIKDSLYERAMAAAAKAGYSSVDELIETAIENELKKTERDADDQLVEDQLRGLGYIE